MCTKQLLAYNFSAIEYTYIDKWLFIENKPFTLNIQLPIRNNKTFSVITTKESYVVTEKEYTL